MAGIDAPKPNPFQMKPLDLGPKPPVGQPKTDALKPPSNDVVTGWKPILSDGEKQALGLGGSENPHQSLAAIAGGSENKEAAEASKNPIDIMVESIKRVGLDPSISAPEKSGLGVIATQLDVYKQDMQAAYDAVKARFQAQGSDVARITDVMVRNEFQKRQQEAKMQNSWRVNGQLSLTDTFTAIDTDTYVFDATKREKWGEPVKFSEPTKARLMQELGFMQPGETFDQRLARISKETHTETGKGAQSHYDWRAGSHGEWGSYSDPDRKHGFMSVTSDRLPPEAKASVWSNYGREGNTVIGLKFGEIPPTELVEK